jgi:endonuclease YncB( thermonuclease family)
MARQGLAGVVRTAAGIAIVGAILLAAGCEELRGLASAAEPGADTATGKTTIVVIDADTVELAGVRYRLTGLDAPEINAAKCQQERQLGIVAAAWLIELIAKRGARLDTGPAGAKPRRDKYGRVLARLVLGGPKGGPEGVEQGGEDWAAIAIRHGHGRPYDGRGPRSDWCGK